MFLTIIAMASFNSCKKDEVGYKHDASSPIAVHDFLPKEGGGGTEILINGTNFSSDTSEISVKINGIPLKIIGSKADQIMAVVPKMGGTGPIEVRIGNNAGISEQSYQYVYTRTVSTLAGNGKPGFANGKGTDAMFNFSGESWYRGSGIAVDNDLNVYVTDVGNHCIRKIDKDGNVTILAGSPSNGGFADGKGTAARFSIPYGLTIDDKGNLYSVDPGNWDIRKIAPDGTATTLGYAQQEPWSIGFDKTSSQLFYTGAHASAQIYTIDSKGASKQVISEVNYPSGLAFDDQGNMYITLTGANQIKKFNAGNWNGSIIAGSGQNGLLDGPGVSAKFASPWGIAIDKSNNIYVAGNGTPGGDIHSPDQSIRYIDAVAHVVSTFAGSSSVGFVNAIGAAATFSGPIGVTVDKHGTVYVLDKNNNSVRKIVSE